jgi:hypothetical protein
VGYDIAYQSNQFPQQCLLLIQADAAILRHVTRVLFGFFFESDSANEVGAVQLAILSRRNCSLQKFESSCPMPPSPFE